MKVVIIGSNGQLGSQLMKAFEGLKPIGLNHNQIEILDTGDIEAMMEAYKPDWVICTASYHRVDEIESQADRALMVNGIGAFNLAQASYKYNVGLVYYSTDYVFDGLKGAPYIESDQPKPLNAYGVSKYVAEQFVAMYAGRFILIRVSGLFGADGSRSKGGNFVTMMLNKARRRETIRVVNDQIFAPSACDEVADRTRKLIEIGKSGIYHLAGEGEATWFEFAKKIFEFASITPDLVPITTEEWNAPARRPRYSVLANTRARALGLPPLSHWQESLERYILETFPKKGDS
ncbi:MAG: dTDP-4-dehydrorhamnose reductase [Myxococcota bacterium]